MHYQVPFRAPGIWAEGEIQALIVEAPSPDKAIETAKALGRLLTGGKEPKDLILEGPRLLNGK